MLFSGEWESFSVLGGLPIISITSGPLGDYDVCNGKAHKIQHAAARKNNSGLFQGSPCFDLKRRNTRHQPRDRMCQREPKMVALLPLQPTLQGAKHGTCVPPQKITNKQKPQEVQVISPTAPHPPWWNPGKPHGTLPQSPDHPGALG